MAQVAMRVDFPFRRTRVHSFNSGSTLGVTEGSLTSALYVKTLPRLRYYVSGWARLIINWKIKQRPRRQLRRD